MVRLAKYAAKRQTLVHSTAGVAIVGGDDGVVAAAVVAVVAVAVAVAVVAVALLFLLLVRTDCHEIC